MTIQALLVGHNPASITTISERLKNAVPDVVLTAALTVNDAKQMLSTQRFNVVIIDHILSDGTALDVLKYSQKFNNQLAFIVQAETYDSLQETLQYPHVYPLITVPGYLEVLPALVQQTVINTTYSEAVLDAVQEGILLLDGQSNILYLNKCMQELIGDGDVIGQPRAEAVNRAVKPLARRYVSPVQANGSNGANGVGYIEVYVAADSIIKPEPPGSVAEDLAQLRDRLMSRISHEVKTPLTSVLGFAHMMLSRPDAPIEKREKWANFIHTKSDLLNRIMDNILNFTAMQSGYSELKLQIIDAAVLARDTVTEFETMETGRQVEVDIPNTLPDISVDSAYFQQALSNLLINAHQATPAGAAITMRASAVDKTVQFTFVDRGKTIKPEEYEAVFAPFSAEPGAGYQPGKGLWLPLARSIVEAHGGRLWIEPTPNGGSTFVVSVPSC